MVLLVYFELGVGDMLVLIFIVLILSRVMRGVGVVDV